MGRALLHLCRALVVLGGLLLAGSALLTTSSRLSHVVLNQPWRSEFELVTFGASWAIYLFLPYCQMVKGNVIVDFFLAGAPRRLKLALDALGTLLFAIIAALLVWRMSVGGIEIRGTGQDSAVVGIQYWWSFPLAVACLAVLCAVTLYGLWQNLRALRT